ncbi:UDP-N-acetylmuramoyl-L-alanine--D-glutamate ligase [Massilia arenosa]|uniref:UDP-N-acetylmuramoylalanine--D-glutamate ligase n=1 Tax=Zemynaea arenosa TaxID=2561931 RepID=A0A4Y9SD55_9BURK|nr:UDP-N-acetylmuramoyl-L-alanine--D-glutamate ligase [Massilia arenosa]TFW18442.1 UDP-N-acetylmuramoyl-L-alanine--D-glutamate ligase [Massilia arenosa]
MNYTGKHVLVLGLGESGLAMAQWLHRCGARVRLADTREAPARLDALRTAVASAEFVHGEFGPHLLDGGIDFVAVSPGLAPTRELALINPAAQERSIPVWGEIELFAQALAHLKEHEHYTPKVLAITGTNGKTTVTSLTGLLCRRAGLSTKVAGNISPAALDVLREALDANALPAAWVLELSSFQLHSTYSLNPDAATVLNITQDHLDWHGSMHAYAADKERIFGADTIRILNRDDPTVMQMAFGATAGSVTFGTDEPTLPETYGLVFERGVTWLVEAVGADDEAPKKRKKNEPPPPVEVTLKHLMPSDALRIRGLHNASNALAALALCRAIGLPMVQLLHGLREYQGEPHRVELVAAIDDVEYYDDSKGTNVGATVAALQGLGKSFNANQKIVLIAGGDGKGQEFDPLAEPVSRYVRAVALIGRDAPAIRAALQGTGVELIDCATLPDAVQRAKEAAQAGDAVLLSPACASLDMFTNYAHRAQVFVEAVREIALEKGQEL